MGYCLYNLFGRSSSHIRTKFWFWYATESQCTTDNCNALSFAQACIGNKNLCSKTDRSIKNCGGICELCAKSCYETAHIQGAV